MATTGSFTDYAKHIGASKAYVSSLKKAGRLVIRQEGKRDVVDFDLSDRLIRNTADMSRAKNGANANNAADRQPSAPLAPLVDAGVDAIYRKAQAQQRSFDAKRSELEYRKASGLVLEREPAERAVFDAFRNLRDATFAACRSAAPMVIGLTDTREVQAALEDAMRGAFEDFEKQMRTRIASGFKQ